ncbi:uncharacterized protein CTRU02_212242 [Colletotrichum truncatum]|uniref:Uncharacterized protein n=1 Tax=Colletotrichum truncatum TaxID=5467 RepID=A0ACC3YMZ9_COLTU|nr:uncharacterized protein CTRU02_08879 [Colletotrichum truncatum]KAF6789632.1 hypothetical protein CTRU02_08879 [Colletotrichum truncatum]
MPAPEHPAQQDPEKQSMVSQANGSTDISTSSSEVSSLSNTSHPRTATAASSQTVQPSEVSSGGVDGPAVAGPAVAGPAVAGAAVGCLVAGLLIGFVAAFFLLRRKYHRTAKNSSFRPEMQHIAVNADSKAFGSSPTATHNNEIQLDQFLLDLTPDKEIASELHALSELVCQHVDNHYHRMPVQANSQSLVGSLLNIGIGDNPKQISADQVAALCVDPQTRQIGLKYVISHAVFVTVDFNARSRFSLLPPPVAFFLQSMPPVETRGGDNEVTAFALSKWRTLSAFLLHPSRSQRIHLSPVESEIAPRAHSLATALNAYLHHFVPADQGSQSQQLEHLKAVIMECARFGYELLSQPREWHFIYQAEDAGTSGQRAVVVCPGLEKMGNSDRIGSDGLTHVVAPLVAQVSDRRRQNR